MKIHLSRNAKGEPMATFERNPKATVQVESVTAEGYTVEAVEAADNMPTLRGS